MAGFLSRLFGSSSNTVKAPPIPGNSITMIAPEASASRLGLDAFRSLEVHLERKFNCRTFASTKVDVVGVEGELLLDGKGQLHGGVVTETWHLDASGTKRKVGMVFKSDGSGGNLVAIADL